MLQYFHIGSILDSGYVSIFPVFVPRCQQVDVLLMYLYIGSSRDTASTSL